MFALLWGAWSDIKQWDLQTIGTVGLLKDMYENRVITLCSHTYAE